MNEFIVHNRKKLILWSSVSVAAILLGAFAVWLIFVPYMYVSLDVNPSIEYSVNHLNRVLSVRGVNGDGSDILNGVDLKSKPIGDAVKETVRQISAKGYFDGSDPGAVEITTSEASGGATQDSDILARNLQNEAQTATADEGKTVDVEAESVGLDRVKEARELGISPGKLNLIQKLQASSDDPSSITVDDWKDKPVKDILKTIKDNRKAGQKNSPDGQDSTTTTETADDSSGKTDDSAAVSTIGSTEGKCRQTANPGAEQKSSNATKHCDDTKAPDSDDAENNSGGQTGEEMTSGTVYDSTSAVTEPTGSQAQAKNKDAASRHSSHTCRDKK